MLQPLVGLKSTTKKVVCGNLEISMSDVEKIKLSSAQMAAIASLTAKLDEKADAIVDTIFELFSEELAGLFVEANRQFDAIGKYCGVGGDSGAMDFSSASEGYLLVRALPPGLLIENIAKASEEAIAESESLRVYGNLDVALQETFGRLRNMLREDFTTRHNAVIDIDVPIEEKINYVVNTRTSMLTKVTRMQLDVPEIGTQH